MVESTTGRNIPLEGLRDPGLFLFFLSHLDHSLNDFAPTVMCCHGPKAMRTIGHVAMAEISKTVNQNKSFFFISLSPAFCYNTGKLTVTVAI